MSGGVPPATFVPRTVFTSPPGGRRVLALGAGLLVEGVDDRLERGLLGAGPLAEDGERLALEAAGRGPADCCPTTPPELDLLDEQPAVNATTVSATLTPAAILVLVCTCFLLLLGSLEPVPYGLAGFWIEEVQPVGVERPGRSLPCARPGCAGSTGPRRASCLRSVAIGASSSPASFSSSAMSRCLRAGGTLSGDVHHQVRAERLDQLGGRVHRPAFGRAGVMQRRRCLRDGCRRSRPLST